MKKTMKMMLALMAGAMAFTACSSDDILENNEVVENASQLKPMTFTAVQEGQGGTRTAIDNLTINWTAGDKISIFDGATENAGVQMFTLASGEGTTSATFTGSAAEASTYYALYPYAVGGTSRTVDQAEAEAAAGECSRMLDRWKRYYEYCDEDEKDRFFDMYHVTDELEDAGVSDDNKAIVYAYIKNEPFGTPGVQLDGSSIKNVVIPAEQTATAGSADPQAMVMVAKGNDKDALQFKNVCAYVKVTPQFNCTAICLKSNGTENIAGKVTVDCSGETPSSTITADGTNSVMLTGTITAGNAYYIAVLPVALTSGFTIEFLTADKTNYYARSTSKDLGLARSNVKNLGEFATSGTWTYNIPTHGEDNGHSWRLITPGFKIATSYASNDPVTFADIPSWGANWVLPAADEMTDLISKGYIVFDKTEPMHSKIRLVGAGVLKYAGDDYIDNGSYCLYLWSSTPGENDDKQTVISNYGPFTSSKTSTNFVLFQYNN